MNDYHLLSTTSMTSAGAAALESVLSGQQMQRVLNDAVWAARVLLHVDASIIFLAESQAFRAIVWHGWEAGGTQISAENVAATAFRAGRRSISWSRREKCSDAALTALMEQLGLQSGMLVPVLVGGDLRAIWLVATQAERSFAQADELTLYTLAENVGLTTESALLSAENLRYRREADALYEIGKEITQLMDLDRVLEVIAEKARDLLGAEISYIALADDEPDQAVHVRVTKGTWTDMLKRMVLKYGEGVGGYVAATRTPLLLDNYPEDPRPKPPGVANLVATEDIISVLCVPMSTRTRTIGVLYVATRRPGSFQRSQLDLLTALGDHAAVAIENARLYEEERITSEKLRALECRRRVGTGAPARDHDDQRAASRAGIE